MTHVRTSLLFLFCAFTICSAQTGSSIALEPILVPRLQQTILESRSIYSVNHRFTDRDTVLFIRKTPGLSVVAVDSVGPAELSCHFRVDSTFSDYGVHDLIVSAPGRDSRPGLQLEVRLNQMPVVHHVTVYQNSVIQRDTLRLSSSGRTLAALVLSGQALLASSTVEFDDPAVKVVSESSRRFNFSPDSLRVSLEVDAKSSTLGKHSFRIQSPFGPEGFGSLMFISDQRPRITGTVPTLMADGRERKVRLLGENFFNGIQVSLLPNEGSVAMESISANSLEIGVNLAVLDKNQTFRVVVANADGQADTSNFFIGQAMPLSAVRVQRIEDGVLFLNRKTRLVLAVQVAANRRLHANRSYEISVDTDRFPVTRVIDDSTCEAELLLQEQAEKTFLDRRAFTVSESGSAPSWKGILEVRQPPQITYVSSRRVFHPLDTLGLIIKGSRLAGAELSLDEPEVSFKILDSRDDLIRTLVVSSRAAAAGVYPLQLRVANIPFGFPDYSLTVQPWRPFSEFARMDVTSQNGIVVHSGWSKSTRPINSDDVIRVTLMPEQLPPNSGIQKVEIVGVLLDSANTVRSESLDKKYFSVERGQEQMVWQWRPRIRARSGDRIEVTMRNPGDQNRLVQTCLVKRRWYEAFQPSTSFIIFKIPFNGKATTTILSSIGVGMSYQPQWMQKFMSVDVAFILGNVTTDHSTYSIQTGVGASVIFWNYLQLGVGADLTGDNKNPMFLFVGSRFKLPSPWSL